MKDIDNRNLYFLEESKMDSLKEKFKLEEFSKCSLIGTKSYFYSDHPVLDIEIMGAVPIYTTTDLLNFLPENFMDLRLCIYKNQGKWVISYMKVSGETVHKEESDNLKDIAYNTLIWIIENEKKRKN